MFGQLCRDEPMVRRAAAKNLAKFAATVEKGLISSDIIPLFHDLTNDGTDQLKLTLPHTSK